jgi:LmbE family N-acetylglucosaminyl deacetylase
VPHTLVALHAHPDDESLLTGGTLARAAAQGHRVVLVVATAGERGLAQESAGLGARRVAELERAAGLLGVARTLLLGYGDSGFREPVEPPAGSLCAAPVDEVAARVATVLEEEHADVLTVYDDNGGYGHPDHIQVHRVGLRAAEIAGVGTVYEATIDRDRMRSMLQEAAAGSDELAEMARGMLAEGGPSMGSPAAVITTRVDVTPWLDAKRAAMVVHASQISPDSWFLSMPAERFAGAFGTECFIKRGAPSGTVESDVV